ncbi:mercury resistance system periplasmic binding protein MerP [Piscinibacter sakaiensis]|uniref:mercury resistance system periplasmic binding protein MerP n=1 Tax=Piscinibacter sakaiensis TaxID=1547922 RepID=UPI003AAE68E8
MNKSNFVLACIAIALPNMAVAAVQTVTLSVPTMDCPVCPITVKKALSKVDGVSKAEVDYDKRQATVTFDDSRTDSSTLTKATANAGYPSSLAAPATAR